MVESPNQREEDLGENFKDFTPKLTMEKDKRSGARLGQNSDK